MSVLFNYRLPAESAVRTTMGSGNANGSMSAGGGGGAGGVGSELFEKFQRQKLNKENGHGSSSSNDR